MTLLPCLVYSCSQQLLYKVMLAFKQQLQFQFVEHCCQNQIYFKCLLLPASLPKVLSLRAMLCIGHFSPDHSEWV